MGTILHRDFKRSIPVDKILNISINEFLDADSHTYDGLRKTSSAEKVSTERQIKKQFQSLLNKFEPYRSKDIDRLSPDEIQELKKISIDFILEIDKSKLLFDKPFLKFFIDKGYLESTEAFVQRANNEDGMLSNLEVAQAIRNVWIMNSLQILSGISVELTDSIYSYSMLYPYTDNYIDDPNISFEDKNNFNDRLMAVLYGEEVETSTLQEARVFELIGNIETQYNRQDYPQVHESIILIQEGQIESLKQDSKYKLNKHELMPISFFKGGCSVLADAYLVKGNLSEEEMYFSFQYGTFLQLLDDLQDISSDRKAGHQTLFSILKEDQIVDHYVEKLISYIYKVNELKTSDNDIMIFMKDIIRSCTMVMIMDVVGRNPKYFSKRLYNKLEAYSKVRLPFYAEIESQLKSLLKNFELN